jgi:hypothetical protein
MYINFKFVRITIARVREIDLTAITLPRALKCEQDYVEYFTGDNNFLTNTLKFACELIKERIAEQLTGVFARRTFHNKKRSELKRLESWKLIMPEFSWNRNPLFQLICILSAIAFHTSSRPMPVIAEYGIIRTPPVKISSIRSIFFRSWLEESLSALVATINWG